MALALAALQGSLHPGIAEGLQTPSSGPWRRQQQQQSPTAAGGPGSQADAFPPFVLGRREGAVLCHKKHTLETLDGWESLRNPQGAGAAA